MTKNSQNTLLKEPKIRYFYTKESFERAKKESENPSKRTCKRCKKEIEGRKTKQFCSYYCRHKYWKDYKKGYKEKDNENNKKRYFATRLEALKIVSDGNLTCSNCGCDDIRILEINHINGRKEIDNFNRYDFYRKIICGERKTDDLNILCRVCNATHFVKLKYGTNFIIKPNKNKNKHMEILKTIVKMIFWSAITVLVILGIELAVMMFLDFNYRDLPAAAINSILYTRMANEYHPEVQAIADNITETCKQQTPYIVDCQIVAARDFLVENYKYAPDFSAGYWNKAFNMIVENATMGDCEDWSITLCSLLRHMGIACVVRSPSFDHVISVIKNGDYWYPVEPQNHKTGAFKEFEGFLI